MVGGRGAFISRDVACEGDSLVLSCADSNTRIQVAAAVYGRLEKSTCPHATNGRHDWAAVAAEKTLKCHMRAADRLKAIDNVCNGQSSCSLTASNDAFVQTGGDPCPNIFKYLEVTYTCVDGTTRAPRDNQRRHEPPPHKPTPMPKSKVLKTDKFCSSEDGPLCTLVSEAAAA